MSDDELYEYLDQKFEWNRVKAAKNLFDHGVRFSEAATVFMDKRNITLPDEDHTSDEERYTVRPIAHASCRPCNSWRADTHHQRPQADTTGEEHV